MRKISLTTASILVVIQSAGCTPVPRPAVSVSDLVRQRTGIDAAFERERSPRIDQAVANYLSRPLTVDDAVRIALLNNPGLAVQLEEVGVAEADFVIASQIRNPAVYVDARLPDRRPPSGTDIEATATMDLLDVLLLPLRKKIAQQQLDQSAVRTADAALALMHDVRVAVYTFAAHQQQLDFQKQLTEASAAADDFAGRQQAAGNLNDLDRAAERATYAEAQLQLAHADAQLVEDREQINRLLGLTGTQTTWTMSVTLPPVPADEVPEQQQIKTALNRRLDVAVQSSSVTLARDAVTYTHNGLLNEVRVGASMERQSDGQTVVGPSLGLELPIFNQHQGQVALAEAELRLAMKNQRVKQVQVESEIRSGVARIDSARASLKIAKETLLPQRQAVTAAAQRQYNGMLIGLYELLRFKQDELLARREVVDTELQYWIARADLERSLGR